MNNLVRDIDAEIESQSLLKHKFYRMWSDGELTREDLAGYSMEYFQLVRAVPAMVGDTRAFMTAPSAKRAASEIKREETDHVRLWEHFAASLGVSPSALARYRGTPKTRKAVASLREASRESFCGGAAAMYSIEYEQPKISRTKLDGLRSFYGMTGDEDATEYFREHEVADVRHAAFWRARLETDVAPKEQRRAVRASKLSLGAQNAILDAVMEKYVSPRIA